MQTEYENEITAIEDEYMRQLDEKDETIAGLKQELHYFANQVCLSSLDDNTSTVESVYDVCNHLYLNPYTYN